MSASSDLNTLMKFLELLYNPQFAQMTGTFDPLVATQQNESPLARAYMNSSNEDVARVFSGLVAGEYDPITAKQELSDLDLGDLETGPLYSAVDNVFKETYGGGSTGGGSSGGKKGSLSAAGLPSQLETYLDKPELAPMGEKAKKAYQGFDKELALLRSIAPNKKKGREGESLSTKGLDKELATSINSLGDEEKVKLYEMLDKDAIATWKKRRGVQKENAQRLTDAGRTPFNDNLMSRAAMLKTIFGQ
jgi:hypothetical protein